MNNKLLVTLESYGYNNPDFDLFRIYKLLDKNFSLENIAFTAYIKSIIKLVDFQYNFQWLTNTVNKLNNSYKRKDIQQFCDDLCYLFGDNIIKVCSDNIIVSKPSKFENYCPFSTESRVIYYYKPINQNTVIVDNNKYYIDDIQMEKTPYYTIACHSIKD